MRHMRTQGQRGFTILELIVAVSVSLVMLFLIGQLFSEASSAVSLGMSVSDVIATSRGFGDQLERDASSMIQPTNQPRQASSGGVLVIINRVIDADYKTRDGTIKRRKVRADQVYWLRDLRPSGNGHIELPIAPKGGSNFDPPAYSPEPGTGDLGQVTAIKVWYGHGLKTNSTGQSPRALTSMHANSWALCRHAVFLTKDASLPAKAQSALAADMKTAVTDVADMAYADGEYAGGTFVGRIGPNGGMPAPTLWAALDNSQYKSQALAFAYLSPNELHTNPNPDFANLSVQAVAKMHTLMADNISDFIVEFAADAIDDTDVQGFPDGRVDEIGSSNDRKVRWYGWPYGHTGNNDTPKTEDPDWGDHQSLNSLLGDPEVQTLPGGQTGKAFVFRHDYPVNWPYMLRIRYRVHDKRAQLQGDEGPEPERSNSGKWFEQLVEVNRD